MTKPTSSRVEWIDAAKALAISLVVLVHAVESTSSLSAAATAKMFPPSRLLLYTAFLAGRLGVPLFLMASGWLLLDRDYPPEKAAAFYRRSWLPLLAVTELWNLFYLLFLALAQHTPFSLQDVVIQLLFLRDSPMSHMWYMSMILGWYLLIPLLANGLRSIGPRAVALPAGLLGGYVFLFSTLQPLCTLLGLDPLRLKLLPGLSGGGYYGLYLVLGWMVRRGCFHALPLWLPAVGTALTLAGGVAWRQFLFSGGVSYAPWYADVWVVLCSLCLFLLLSRLEGRQMPAPVNLLGRFSFPIYLLHNPIRLLLWGPVNLLPHISLRLAAFWVATMALSLALALALSRFRAGRLALYLR